MNIPACRSVPGSEYKCTLLFRALCCHGNVKSPMDWHSLCSHYLIYINLPFQILTISLHSSILYDFDSQCCLEVLFMCPEAQQKCCISNSLIILLFLHLSALICLSTSLVSSPLIILSSFVSYFYSHKPRHDVKLLMLEVYWREIDSKTRLLGMQGFKFVYLNHLRNNPNPNMSFCHFCWFIIIVFIIFSPYIYSVIKGFGNTINVLFPIIFFKFLDIHLNEKNKKWFGFYTKSLDSKGTFQFPNEPKWHQIREL